MDVSTASDLTTADADVVAVAFSGEPPAELGVAELLEAGRFPPRRERRDPPPRGRQAHRRRRARGRDRRRRVPHGGRSGRAPAARDAEAPSAGCSETGRSLAGRSRPARSSTGSCSAATTPGRWKTENRTKAILGSCSSAGSTALSTPRRERRRRSLDEPRPRPRERAAERADPRRAWPSAPRRSRPTLEHLSAEALGPDEIERARHGRARRGRRGKPQPAAPDRAALRPARTPRDGPRARARRQGGSRSTRAASR